jgi:chromosome segregation ATPase
MCLDDYFLAVRRAFKGIASTSSLLNVQASQQQQIKDLHSQIQSSTDSYNTKKSSLDAMKLEKAKLEAQLSALNSRIQDEENQIADLPNVIDQAKKQIKACIKKDVLLRAKLQNAQNSNDRYQKVIAEFNQTKTRVIDVIKNCLNL